MYIFSHKYIFYALFYSVNLYLYNFYLTTYAKKEIQKKKNQIIVIARKNS